MFEFEQPIVDKLLDQDKAFRHLYEKYAELKKEIKTLNQEILSDTPNKLENLKKEKLMLKDKMANIIEAHKNNA